MQREDEREREREERYLRELEQDRRADYTPPPPARIWSVVLKSEPLTWERLAHLGLATRESRAQGIRPPVEFDVAVGFTRGEAERLQGWLAEHGVVAGVIETPRG